MSSVGSLVCKPESVCNEQTSMLFAGALMGSLMGSFLGLDLLTHMVLIFFPVSLWELNICPSEGFESTCLFP